MNLEDRFSFDFSIFKGTHVAIWDTNYDIEEPIIIIEKLLFNNKFRSNLQGESLTFSVDLEKLKTFVDNL